MSYLKYAFHFTICLWILAHTNYLKADEFNWHGFAAQGLIQSDNSNFINTSGEPSLKLTELGFNGAYQLSNDVRFSGQIVYLNGGNRYPEGVRLDYLFVDWNAWNKFNWNIDVHLGRYKNYHWLYSATRDVPHTRPTIVLPQSIYFDVFRDVALGSDGIAILAKTNTSWGEWDINWSYGATPISEEQKSNLIGSLAAGNLKQKFANQFSLYFRPDASHFTIGFSLLNSDFKYTQAPVDFFIDGKATSQRVMVSMLYSGENFEIASELVQERAYYQNLILPGFERDSKAQGGYIQGRYFLNKDLSGLIRLDIFDLDKNDRSGKHYSNQTGGPNYFAYMDTLTIGTTWQFTKNWEIMAEYHRSKGRGRLAPVFFPDLEHNKGKYWNMWAVQLMYWF